MNKSLILDLATKANQFDDSEGYFIDFSFTKKDLYVFASLIAKGCALICDKEDADFAENVETPAAYAARKIRAAFVDPAATE